MDEHRLPETSCPFCGHEMDAATSVGSSKGPKAGDFSLCIACGEWLVFTADQHVRKPTDAEYGELNEHSDVHLVREAWLQMMQTKGLK